MSDDDKWGEFGPPLDESGKVPGEVRGKGRYMAWIGDDAVKEVERDDHHCYREVMEMPNGEEPIVAFIRGKFGPPCACGAISTVQCDFPIGEEERTCDRYCCERCAPTVGHDKNFCPEHMAAGAGENMVLFKRPVTRKDLSEAAKRELEMGPPPKPPRIERKPKYPFQYRVVYDTGTGQDLGTMKVLTRWMTQLEASDFAKTRGSAHFVQSYDEYEVLFRKKYPPRSRKRPPRKPPG